MSFLTPALAIAGAVAAALPIIIHLLFRRRRAPLPWAAMRFLMEAYRKQRRRMQMEQWLLMLVRCLILLVLGMALARPLLAGKALADAGGDRTVAILIDNGLASNVRLGDGMTAFEQHVESAETVIDALQPGDRVTIITAARPVRLLIDPPTSDHGSAKRVLEDVSASQAATDISAALDRLAAVRDGLDGARDQLVAYLMSEFRAGSADLQRTLSSGFRADEAGAARLMATAPAEQSIGNVQVTAVDPVRRFVAPGAADPAGQVRVRLARTGADLPAASSVVTLDVERTAGTTGTFTRPEPRTVEWDAGQSAASVEFFIDLPDELSADVALTAAVEPDALPADDERHSMLSVRTAVRTLLFDRRRFGLETRIDELDAGEWLRRALAPMESSAVDVVEIEPGAVEMRDLRAADVVLLPRPDLLDEDGWRVLARFVRSGGLLIITPPAELTVHAWTDAVRDELGMAWRIAREVETADDSGAHDDASRAGVDSAWTLAAEQPESGLLRLLAPELGGLASPVRVLKRLPVEVEGAAEVVLQFADGEPFIVAGKPSDAVTEANEATEGKNAGRPARAGSPAARGMVVYLAAAPVLEWTNLPSKPLIVPLVQETVREGLSAIRTTEPAVAGGRPLMTPPEGTTALRSSDGERIALEHGVRPTAPLTNAGVYTAIDEAGRALGPVVVNVPVAAGDTATQLASSVEAWLQRHGPWTFAADREALGTVLERADDRTPLATTLLIALAGLLLVESLLARRFSRGHEALADDSAGRGAAMKAIRPTIDEPADGKGETL